MAAVRSMHNVLGGTIDPHAAYLLLRGMKTLDVRVQRQNSVRSPFRVKKSDVRAGGARLGAQLVFSHMCAHMLPLTPVGEIALFWGQLGLIFYLFASNRYCLCHFPYHLPACCLPLPWDNVQAWERVITELQRQPEAA